MRFLHISTDCVFDGSRGYYLEGDPPSPADLYGRTKLAGEALDARSTVIRTSFIGPHEDATGLMEWVSSQPRGSSVDGYADHMWNGVTTTALGALVRSWVLGLAHFEPLQHIYSWPPVSKSDLLIQLQRCLSRDDLRIHPRPTGHPRNQALLSAFPSSLEEAWSSIGYSRIPHITALLDRL
jgi:dTDP-4-dehydrorhamnose reductase